MFIESALDDPTIEENNIKVSVIINYVSKFLISIYFIFKHN